MALTKERIRYLLQAYSDRTATEEEEDALFEWLSATPDDAVLQDHIALLIKAHAGESFPEVDWDDLYKRVVERAELKGGDMLVLPMPARRVIWYRAAAVAAVLLLTGAGIYLFTQRRPRSSSLAADQKVRYENDIRPGGAKAILQAGNARIVLDRKDTSFTLAGNTVHINGGKLKIADKRPTLYTLITPRGGDYRLVLEDGTKVWLNAGSRLVYPAVFTGKTREVTLEGEAYFEVHTDAAHPFVVKTARQRIRVLGTAFNIHAYADEANVVTTLVAGKVQVNCAAGNLTLRAGQQAKLDRSGRLALNPDADTEQAVAWKNGYFRFVRADIHTIMRRLARWYDIRVQYAPDLKQHYFGAIINRNNNISGILNILEATGEVHFKIEGKEVFVGP